MNFEIPEGLTDLLQDFTVAVLRERPQPNTLIDFAANYFAKLQEGNRKSENKRGVTFSEPANDDEESDIEDSPVLPANKYVRRKSVCAERYDPEADENENEPKVVYPKSDEQRDRLAEAVKPILLFRALDETQMQDVLDAMFEKKVVYEVDVPLEEINGPVYFLREDKTPLSQHFHETVAISTTPGYDRYYEGTKVEYFNDRWYEQEVRYLPGIPPRKTFSSTVCYIPVNGKKHIWFRDSVYLRFDLPSPKTFSTKVFLYPRRKVESHVTGVEHTDEKLVKYYRVAVDLQLRDYVSLELVPLDQ